MFHKLFSIIAQQDLDSEVDIELLRKANVLMTDNGCDTYFISALNTTIRSGKYSVCCHGLSNYNPLDSHVKLLSWRLFGLLVFLYYSNCDKKYILINSLVNIIQNNTSKRDIEIIDMFITRSSVDLDYITITKLYVFLFPNFNSKNKCKCNLLSSVSSGNVDDIHTNDTNKVNVDNVNKDLSLKYNTLVSNKSINDQSSDSFYNKSDDPKYIIMNKKTKIIMSMLDKINDIVDTSLDLDNLTKSYYLTNLICSDNNDVEYFNTLDGSFKRIQKCNNSGKQTKKVLKYESDNSDESDESELECSELDCSDNYSSDS